MEQTRLETGTTWNVNIADSSLILCTETPISIFFHDCLDVYIEVDNQRTPKIKLELTKGKRVKNYFNTFVQCHYIWNQF